MKLLFIANVLICFLISCKTSADKQNLQAEKNTSNSKEVYHAVETGDVSKLDNFIAPDAVDHSGATEIKGRDSIKAMLGNIHNHFKGIKIEILSRATSDDGTYNYDMVKFTGTTTDDSMGVPPNTKMESIEVYVVRIKDGMNLEHWRFIDNRDAIHMMQAEKNNSSNSTKK